MVPPEASCTLQYARSRQRARYGGIALTRPGLFAISAFALLLVCAGGAQAAERFDFPDVGPYQVLRCDFHMHTIISDGRLTGRERVEEAKKLGYDVIAITDHGQLLAYRSAKYVGDQIGVLVIRGLESGVRSKEHYVVLGIDSAYKPRDSHRWAESKGEETVFYQEQMAEVARRGGLIIWAHPHVGFREPSLWGMKQGIIQGIELKNDVVGEGWNTKKSHGSNWYPDAFGWAMEHNLAMLACTDAHGSRSDQPAVSLVLAQERSEKGVMDAIRARRTAAWFDGMLWGRKELLGQLVGAMVRGEAAGGTLKLTNLGPVPLKGVAGGGQGEAFELPPYQSVSVAASAGNTAVRWENVWTGLTENLTSEYGPARKR